MTTPATRLRTWAEQALSQYDAETAAGGEPVYPQAAADVLAVLKENEQLKREAVEG